MSHHNVRYVTLTCGNSATRLNDMKVMEQQNTPTRIRTFLRTAGAVVAVGSLGVFGAACGDDEEKDTTPATEAPDVTEAPTDTTTEGTDAPAAEILIEGAWARNSPMMAEMGAAYMTITSPVDDKLVAASVDASIAGMVQVHEVVMEMPTEDTMAMGTETTMAMGTEDTMHMGTGDTMPAGEMTMREVEFVELPAGMAVQLKPGGYHIMLMDLVAPLELGTTITITLVFENAGEITVEVPVLEEAPAA